MTMSRGAQGGAAIFELSPSGSYYKGRLLHSFVGPQVIQQYESLVLDSGGSVYSSSSVGGASACSCGLVYKLTLNGSGRGFSVPSGVPELPNGVTSRQFWSFSVNVSD